VNWLIPLILVLSQVLYPTGRVKPVRYNLVKRTVGVNIQVIDKTTTPYRWWAAEAPYGKPNWEHVQYVRNRYDIDAVALMLRAHPTENQDENIRKLFRLPGITSIVIRPEHWGVIDERCDGSLGLLWEGYPVSIYDDMYRYYSGQDKDIFIINLESDWQAHGVGCRARDECIGGLSYQSYLACCEDPMCGWTPTMDYLSWTSCQIMACDEEKLERAEYLLRLFNERQAAAEAARAAHPNATVRVWHTVEVNFYGNKDWQFFTVLGNVIPRMDRPPDFIGLSVYDMAGNPEDTLRYAMEATGLPANRFIVSETGTSKKDNQYDIIYERINNLFVMGVRLAFVWDLEIAPVYDTGYSIVDRETGEEFGGMRAVRDLNKEWR